MAKIHSIETFGTVDGPGIRFVVFLQGCPMRCLYCHNPDTWRFDGGKETSVKELLNEIKKYKNYFEGNGGVTVTGGEPLLQIDFVIQLFKELKKQSIHTCLDTSGVLFKKDQETLKKYNELLRYTDLVLLDIKQIDPIKHKELTGHNNENILEFAKYLNDKKIPMWVRYVLVPSYTDNLEDVKKLSGFLKTLTNVEKIEVLPYHTMGLKKYEELGIKYKLLGVKEPSKELIEKIERILKGEKV